MSGKEPVGGPEEATVRKRGRPKKIRNVDEGVIEGKRQKIDINVRAAADTGAQGPGTYRYDVSETRQPLSDSPLGFRAAAFNTESKISQDLVHSGQPSGISTGNVMQFGVEGELNATMGVNNLSDESMRAGAWNVILRVHGSCIPAQGGAAVSPGETGEMGERGLTLCVCCRQPEIKRETIICDSCEQSFHIGCVKLAYRSAIDLDDWSCASCAPSTLGNGDMGTLDQQYQDRKLGRSVVQKSAHRGRPRKIHLPRPQRTLDLNMPADASEELHQMHVQYGSTEENIRVEDSTHMSNSVTEPHQMKFENRGADVSPVPVKEIVVRDVNEDKMQLALGFVGMERVKDKSELSGSERFIDAADTTEGYQPIDRGTAASGSDGKDFATAEEVGTVTALSLGGPEKLAILSKDMKMLAGIPSETSSEVVDVTGNMEEIQRVELSALFNPPFEPQLVDYTNQNNLPGTSPTVKESGTLTLEPNRSAGEFGCVSMEVTNASERLPTEKVREIMGHDARKSCSLLMPCSMGFGDESSGPMKVSDLKSDSGHELQEVKDNHSAFPLRRLSEQVLALPSFLALQESANHKFCSNLQSGSPGHVSRVDIPRASESQCSGGESQVLSCEEAGGTAYGKQDGEHLRVNAEDSCHMEDQQLKVVADETLRLLKEFIFEKYCVSLPDGWIVDVRRRRNDKHLDKYFISPGKHRFRSRVEVIRHLGLSDDPRGKLESQQGLVKDSVSPTQQIADDVEKLQVPFRCGDLTIESLGSVDTASLINNGIQSWPVGYRSWWHDAATASYYISEVVDGGIQTPVFRVTREFCPTSRISSSETAGLVRSGTGEGANAAGRRTVECSGGSQKQEANTYAAQPIHEESVRALLGDLAGPADEEEIQDSGPTFRDEVGEIIVESSSTVLAWRMLAQEFVNRCRKTPWVIDSLPHACPHVKLDVLPSYPQTMDTSGISMDRSAESRLFALLERLEVDHFGLREGLVQEMIRSRVNRIRNVEVENSMGSRFFEDRGLASRPDGLVAKPNSQLRFRAREKARRQKRPPEGLSEEPKEAVVVEPSAFSGKDETFVQPPLPERPLPPPGQPLANRIPAKLVGDVLQIWEFLTRFASVIRDLHPPLLEDLEEGLICGAAVTSGNLGGSVAFQPNLKEDGGNNSNVEPNLSAASTDVDLVAVGSENSKGGLSAQSNKPSTPSQMSLPQLSEGSFQNVKDGAAEVHQQDLKKQGDSRLPAGPVTVPKLEDSYADAVGCSPTKSIASPGFATAGSIHIPIMNYLLSDLLSKLCGRDEVPGESEESKPSRRGRKRVRDTVLRPILGREKLSDSFSMNEWTWPEIARRYIISISSLSKVGEISEVTTSECLKVLRCIQGDGGVLCGALDGVASMEVDAQLLAEAEKELAVGAHEHDDTNFPATPPANGKELEEGKSQEPAGDNARWVKILDPISKLPTNVGSRIRNRVRDALEADPPEWAVQLLEHSISKEVYKGNASGPTKRIVMEVISKYRGEDPKIRKTKKLRKRVIPSPEVVMQRCRIVLRQVAGEDKEHIVSKGIGEMITNFYESEGEGVLPRPLDFRAIDLRLGAGAYGTSPDAFAEDVRQIWKNISSIYGNDSDEWKATNAFSELFESLFSKQVIIFQRGVDNATASTANGHTTGNAGEGAGQITLGGDGSSAQNVQENVKAPWEDDSCRICGIDDDHDNVLLCDGCDAEYHIYCLKPPLQEVPEGNWYCSSCEAVDKGFLEEPTVTEVAPESKTSEKQDELVPQKVASAEDVLEKEQIQSAEPPEDAPSMALATKLEDTDYWHLSLADRVQFLKFLCDRALETLEIRIHMEEIMDMAGEVQQKLRQMLLERRRFTELEEGRVDNSKDAKNACSVLQGSAVKLKRQVIDLGKEPVADSSPLPIDLRDISSSEKAGLAFSLPARDTLNEVATLQASASEDTNRQSTSQEKHGVLDLSNADTIMVSAEEGINSDAAGSQDFPGDEEKSSQILSGSGVTPVGAHVSVSNSATGNNDVKVSFSNTETGRHLLVRSTSSIDGDVTKTGHPRALQSSRDADIENAIAKLRSINIRRDLLGKDSYGREYWALFGCNAKPSVAVETLSSDHQPKTEDADRSAVSSSPTACYSSLNPENDSTGGNESTVGPAIEEHLQRKPENEHTWSIYSDGDALDKLIEWLSPTIVHERSLRTNLLQWRSWLWTGEIADTERWEAAQTLQAKQEGFVTPDRSNNTSLASRGLGSCKSGSVSATASLRATKILEWRYGGLCLSGLKETNSAVGSKRGRKKKSQVGAELSRCKCLEPVWLSRYHCVTCHTTFESAPDLEIHTRETSCSPVKKNAAERETGKKSKKGGQTGKTGQSKRLSEVPTPEHPSALNGKLLNVATMPFIVHETTRDRVNRIGLIADKGPSFAPGLSVAPAFDPSLMMFDSPVGHAISSTEGGVNGNTLLLSTLAVGGTSCISHVDSEDSKSSSWVLVKSFEDLPGKADGASESSGVLMSPEDRLARLGTGKLDPHSTDQKRPENFACGVLLPTGAIAGGRLFKVTGKQLVISEASLVSLADRDLDLLDQLKMNLFDIEAALTSDMLQLGRAQTSRRQAWRSLVKRAKSIYTIVQAAIILEHMVSADYLRNSWGYWSSFSAAAKTATLSSLSLRVYALDAAILYENSLDYVGPESLACEPKQTKKEREREEKRKVTHSKNSGKKKRKDDASTS